MVGIEGTPTTFWLISSYKYIRDLTYLVAADIPWNSLSAVLKLYCTCNLLAQQIGAPCNFTTNP